jgi:hypothetical protein
MLEHHVCCFNHTLQLSVKTLLRPFNARLGQSTKDGSVNDVDDLLNLGNNNNDGEDGEEEDQDEDNDNDLLDAVLDADDIDNGVNELNYNRYSCCL